MIAQKFKLLALACLALCAMSCGGNGDTAKPDSATPAPTKPKPEGRVMNQIPAAEVLGSTVRRNLRYQPNEEVSQYMPVDTLLEYIRKMNLSIRREIGKLKPEAPTAGTVVIGLNAKHETKVWYIFPDGQPSEAFKTATQLAVAAVPKPTVKQRLVVFGIALTLWNYKESDAESGTVEMPAEWKAISDRLKAPQPATKLAEMTWAD